MSALLAAYADEILVEGFMRFLPVAGIAAAFGFVYWLIRRNASNREQKKRDDWIRERREKRETTKRTPADKP